MREKENATLMHGAEGFAFYITTANRYPRVVFIRKLAGYVRRSRRAVYSCYFYSAVIERVRR